MSTNEGGCSCGHVRYRLSSGPMFIHCCHCTICQRQTGGAFVINGLIETDRIELLGAAPVAIEMPTESGAAHDIYRCEKCQVAVWSDYRRRPKLRFVRLATLDAPHTFTPDVHIYVRSKVPWVTLPTDARVFDVSYDIAREWPAESLARRAAIT